MTRCVLQAELTLYSHELTFCRLRAIMLRAIILYDVNDSNSPYIDTREELADGQQNSHLFSPPLCSWYLKRKYMLRA